MTGRSLGIAGLLLVASCGVQTAQDIGGDPLVADDAVGPSTVIGIHHVKLSVSDLDRSLPFYRDATEFAVVEQGAMPSSAALEAAAGLTGLAGERAMLRGPNGQIELVEFDLNEQDATPPVMANGPGATHICLQSPLDRPLYDRFRERGAEPVTRGGEPVDMLGRNYFYMYAGDPDGVMFEVEHASIPQFREDVWLGHVAYATHDIDRLVGFYEELIGHSAYQRADGIGGPTFDQVAGLDDVSFDGGWISANNMIVEFWEYHNPPTVPAVAVRPLPAVGYAAVVFEVADIETDLRRIEAAGGTIASEIETEDGAAIAYARDPDGNLIGLLQLPAGSDRSVTRLKQITWNLG